MSVEPYLRRGVFALPYCDACRRWVWPPSPACRTCRGAAAVQPHAGRGTILESSSRRGVVFCMCELDGGIRIMGRLAAGPRRPGSPVTLSRCGMNGDVPFFEFTPV